MKKNDMSLTKAPTLWCPQCGEQLTYSINADEITIFCDDPDCGFLVNAPTITEAVDEVCSYNLVNVKIPDNVNHPDHYIQGKIECIDALEAATVNKFGLEAICTANIIKYLWRYETKNGIEDIKKAQWYLNKLLEYKTGDK